MVTPPSSGSSQVRVTCASPASARNASAEPPPGIVPVGVAVPMADHGPTPCEDRARTRASIGCPLVRPVRTALAVLTGMLGDHEPVPLLRHWKSNSVTWAPPSSGQFQNQSSSPERGAVAIGASGADGSEITPRRISHTAWPAAVGLTAFEKEGPLSTSAR